FDWDLGGRLYSQGKQNYQRLSGADRLKIIINGQSVCEVDVKASALTIFQALGGHPLDFSDNLDPYALAGLPREVVKGFITATFGSGMSPTNCSQPVAEERKKSPTRGGRTIVAGASPPLADLRGDTAQPPLWARLMYLESEAVLGDHDRPSGKGHP